MRPPGVTASTSNPLGRVFGTPAAHIAPVRAGCVRFWYSRCSHRARSGWLGAVLVPAMLTSRPTQNRGWSAELDALGEGEVVGVVDGVGGPAHVCLPRVTAALTAAAGGLLAAERSADLGATGTDVDVGDAAVTAVGRAEALRLAHVGGEDAAGQ